MAYQVGQVAIPLSPIRRLLSARQYLILVAAPVLMVAMGWGALQADPHVATELSALGVTADGPRYSVTDLQRQVARDPGGWIGRTVLVRGRVATDRTWSAPDSIVTRIALIDPGAPGETTVLSLVWGSADPVRAFLRRLPLLGRVAPKAQVLQLGALATYRVRLRAAPAGSCSFLPCYEALVLDAAP
jgi:hypothetical protein